jgi:hypothetical protein
MSNRVVLVAMVAVVLLLGGMTVLAGQARTYDKPIEVTWDEAVKAARDAELYVTDSNRSEHWFVMRTKRKGGHEIKVSLYGTLQEATVQVDAVDPEEDKQTAKHVTRFLDALDRRMD